MSHYMCTLTQDNERVRCLNPPFFLMAGYCWGHRTASARTPLLWELRAGRGEWDAGEKRPELPQLGDNGSL